MPVVVAVISGVLYHVSQKSAGSISTPWAILTPAYAVALTVSLLLWRHSGGGTELLRRPALLASAGVIGLAIVGIEAGFLLAYRAGWPLSYTSLLVNVAVGALLAVLGTWGLQEGLSLTRAIGLGLSVLGALLLVAGR